MLKVKSPILFLILLFALLQGCDSVPEEVAEDTVSRQDNNATQNTPPVVRNTPDETTAPVVDNTPDETTAPVVDNTPDETTAPVAGNTPDETTAPVVGNTPDETTAPVENNTPNVPELANVAPQISLRGGSTIQVSYSAEFQDPGVTATDFEDGDLYERVVVDTGTLNTSVPGSYTVSYTVTDSAQTSVTVSRTVVVSENTPPLIALNGSALIEIAVNTSFVDPGVKALDLEDGEISESVLVDLSALNTAVAGTYTINYTVEDAAKEQSSTTRTVVVRGVDEPLNTPPTIALVGESIVELAFNAEYQESGALASDTEDGELQESILIDTGNLNTSESGTYTITYTVKDSSQATADVSRIVVVAENRSPSIELVGFAQIEIELNGTYADQGATASDMEDGDLTDSIAVDLSALNTSVAGTYIVNYVITDSGSLSVGAQRVVVVQEGDDAATPQSYSVELTWEAPTEREDGQILMPEEILAYEITYTQVDAEDNRTSYIVEGGATSAVLSNLVSGEYEIRVAVMDLDGTFSQQTTPSHLILE